MAGSLKFILKRLAFAIPVIWGAVTLLFVIFFMLPGDRVDAIVGDSRTASPEVRAHIEHDLGLDRPLIVQYGLYWDHLLHGDLGESIYGQPVSTIIDDAAPASLRLAFWAVLIEAVAGIGAGLVATLRSNRFHRAWTTFWTALFLSLPVFVAAYLLQLAFAVHPYQAGWPTWLRFPAQGIGPDHWWLGVFPAPDEWRFLVLPAITLAFVSTAVVARLMRAGMRTTMSSEYVRGARARGISARQVFLRHGFRNALIPVVTFVGLDFVNLFGSAVITESIFDWPGIGNAIGSALNHEDAQVVLGITLVLAIAYVVVNLFVDITYRFLDPRIGENS